VVVSPGAALVLVQVATGVRSGVADTTTSATPTPSAVTVPDRVRRRGSCIGGCRAGELAVPPDPTI
jgi:hypothetical protein